MSLHNAYGFFSYSTVFSLVIVTVKAEGGSLARRAGEIKAGAADLQPAHGPGDDMHPPRSRNKPRDGAKVPPKLLRSGVTERL